ncbi:MAG: peptidase U32 family protein [Bacteroidales bacterium]|jgi:putative protease
MKGSLKEIEIMSPVGSYESLMAAIQANTDAVYFGIDQLNMRSRSANNFTIDDLRKISSVCKENNIKTYLTLNTIIYDAELDLMKSIVDAAKENYISAIIASDMSVIMYAKKVGIEVHISTQCNITNIEAVKYYSQYADVIVTARELSLKQVAEIVKLIEKEQIKGPAGNLVKIEIFAHGALCMAISGKCYLSLDNMNYSANRGACLQLCRRAYLVKDKEEGYELEIDKEYIMSPKDLCTIGFLDKIIHAGVNVLKIEGRGRSPEYVKTVTACYREAVDAIFNGTYTKDKIDEWILRLGSVYNRGFWDGYYLGRKTGEWTEQYGSRATKTKVYIGKVTNYFSNLKVAEIKIETNEIGESDDLLIIGPTTGVAEIKISEIRIALEKTKSAVKGNVCSIPILELVRRNDKVYKLVDSE